MNRPVMDTAEEKRKSRRERTPGALWGRCPICRARLGEALECTRCGLEFAPMLEAAEQAGHLADKALRDLGAGRSHEAFRDAMRAVQTWGDPETWKALAVAALARGDFALALALWRKLRDNPAEARERASSNMR